MANSMLRSAWEREDSNTSRARLEKRSLQMQARLLWDIWLLWVFCNPIVGCGHGLFHNLR
jgi:hypothetical protein